MLATCFPVAKAVLRSRWAPLVRAFVRESRCHSPLFRDVPEQFVAWLMQAAPAFARRRRLPPWLCELAHYEWVELALEVMPNTVPAGTALPASAETLARQRFSPNPCALNLAYHWPVHRIGPAWRPRKPSPTFVLVYRDRDDRVRFMTLSAVSSRLLHWAGQEGMTGEQACRSVAEEMGLAATPSFIEEGLMQLRQWMDQGVIRADRE